MIDKCSSKYQVYFNSYYAHKMTYYTKSFNFLIEY